MARNKACGSELSGGETQPCCSPHTESAGLTESPWGNLQEALEEKSSLSLDLGGSGLRAQAGASVGP